MKFLQIGLGSMGKRRIRCLKKLGYEDIIGFDLREDRRKEVEEKYNLETTNNIKNINFDNIDILIISTPPDKHNEYIDLAIKKRKPAFIEASVILKGLKDLVVSVKESNILIAPSCTFRFHPSIKVIKELIINGNYGKVCNFIYHIGQYLPDWHPYENIKDFYVSKKETGACREMVPFEMTWIVDIFGYPKEMFAFRGKTIDLGVDIDDTYSINLKFYNSIGNILVDVVTRYANRNLIVNLEKASIFWNWNEKIVKVFDAGSNRWTYYYEPEGKAHEGYNINIIEEMYIEELNTFIKAIKGECIFPNLLEDDIKVLELLETLEKTNKGKLI